MNNRVADAILDQTSEPIPEMISLREASNRTKLSYDILRKWCLSGQIVHIRAGKKIFVNWGKLCEKLNSSGISEGASA